MTIRCGCCGGEHETVDEVRRCCAGEVVARPAPCDPAEPAGAPPRVPLAERAPPPADPPTWDRLAGPAQLGRHLVVRPGQGVPAPWAGAPRVVIDAAAVEQPDAVVTRLRIAAASRERLVIELQVETWPAEVVTQAPHELGAGFELARDALAHLVWANSVDARDPGRPRWAPAERAVALGATAGGPADVVLPDGTAAWCDGGPLWRTLDLDAPVVPRVSLEYGHLRPLGPAAPPPTLAPDQAAAVAHPGGAARIVAPAGSGKTRVLTERARLLVQGWHLPAGAVCVVAYNKRAQEEVVARLTDVPGLRVRTLNALALDLLNGRPPFPPRRDAVRTIDEREVRRLLGRLVKVPRRANTDPLSAWIEALGLARLGLVDGADVERRYGGDVPGFAEVYPRYRAALRRDGAVDFDEQIVRAIEVLLAEPPTRAAAQRSCRLLLVDEFQDLRPAHLLLIRLLASPDLAVFGVGDDDQTIYGYDGADPGWLIDYPRWFPGAGDHPLEVNYRCPPAVVTAADHLVRHNRRRVPKVIRAAKDTGTGWRVVPGGDDPVAATVGAVREALERSRRPGDVAVLARVNVLLVPVLVALRAEGVPVRADTPRELLGRTSVRAALAWLRAAARPDALDAEDVAEIARRPSRRLPPRVLEWVSEQGSVASLRRLAKRLRDDDQADAVDGLAGDLDTLARLVATRPTRAALDHLVGVIGLGGAVARLDASHHGMNRAATGDDLEALRQLASLHPDAATFPAWLEAELHRPADRADDGVTLASVHRVKGQEWPVVVVHAADADQFPHRLADDREEERRVFHVAVTRTSDELVLVTGTQPSPFVAELTAEPPRPGPARRDAAPTTPPTAPRSPLPPRVARPDDEAVRTALRVLRTHLAAGHPAYTVFGNDTLEAIATLRPRTLVELARVPGIGPKRIERYGEAILDALARAATPVDSEPGMNGG